MPKHIACIMDGNRRFAREHNLPAIEGHTKGAERIKDMLAACIRHHIPYLTLYALSTENVQQRSSIELTHLFSLIEHMASYIGDDLFPMTRLRVIGDISLLPVSCQTAIERMLQNTVHHTEVTLTLALNYGGRDELVRTMQRITEHTVDINNILTQDVVSLHLDTAGIPDPELLIRTGGYKRLSNFLLWQCAYTELYFTDVLWPAFDTSCFEEALSWYHTQTKNFGK